VASLQVRNDSYRVIFRFQGQQHFVTLGKVEEVEALGTKARYEHLLRLLDQQLLTMPAGLDVETFLQHDGKPPPAAVSPTKETSFAVFRDAYLQTFGNGALEENTLYTAKIHLSHLATTLGERFVMQNLAHADLQRHIDRRCEVVAGITVKKEIDTLRSAWNWACRMSHVTGTFPSAGLVYPKSEEKLPFMTWAEIERRITQGGDPDELWEALYLTEPQMREFLDFVQTRKVPSWVYPMCVMAAHTGARRSEMMRCERQDVDFQSGIITIREKKKVRGRLTTRRVPRTARLMAALGALPDVGKLLFGELSVQSVQHAFMRMVGKHPSEAKNPKTKARKEAKRRTKWSVVKGYHVLRHSFVSAMAARGIDQRIINELAGHTTEAMARRYRHLVPDLKEAAIRQVFGGEAIPPAETVTSQHGK
jgi:integrase